MPEREGAQANERAGQRQRVLDEAHKLGATQAKVLEAVPWQAAPLRRASANERVRLREAEAAVRGLSLHYLRHEFTEQMARCRMVQYWET